MKELSARANAFLATQKRNDSTTDREEIIETFIANNVPLFEPLIEFQQKYSGYLFWAWLVPIFVGLIQGDGGYPFRSKTGFIDFDFSEDDHSEYKFVCAVSEYQMDFILDEFGRYYEDYRIVASSFDKNIEHHAIWAEIEMKKNFQSVIRDQPLKIIALDRILKLDIIPEASDEYTLWFKNENIYMMQRHGLTTIIASDNIAAIQQIISD